MKVLVIGDSCIDRFIYCNIDRLCPEAPVPVLNPISNTENPGMAGNVVANLEALGVTVDLVTNKEAILKTRYIDDKSGQMVMILDENDKCKPIQQLASTGKAMPYYLIEKSDHDAIVISDYCKGFLNFRDIEQIAQMAKCPTFLDTKKKLGPWCKNISFIKINEPEWLDNLEYSYDNIIVTKGSKGATYKDKTYDTKPVKVSNVSGAGDTFLAGLVYKYIDTKLIGNSIDFANECSSKVVQKRGVVTI